MTDADARPDTDTTQQRVAAVLGHPIAHSLSPVMHRTAYEELGLPWTYHAIDVRPEDLPHFVDTLGPEWAGLSLTMPLKEAVLPLLDRVDLEARSVRSVNTVVFENGQRIGYNTDIDGLIEVLTIALDGRSLVEGPRALVIGAGATARSTVAALSHCAVDEVSVSARRLDAAEELADLASDLSMYGRVASWPASEADLSCDVVISTVPYDVAAALAPPDEPGALVDVLYDPWPTPLAQAWAEAGGQVIGGLELLVRQAVKQVQLMTGRRPDIARMRAAGEAALRERANS
ncbi:MAG TPA: shikimate dehydrogenase [Actinomycetes bacterium]|nr:shikimate dehydrogenase [Actinomycetes bacterium]